VTGKTEFGAEKPAGLWADIGNFFSSIFWWAIGIAAFLVFANIVLFVLYFIPPTSPYAAAILKVEGYLIPYIGTILAWLKARLATSTLATTVANVEKAATTGAVTAPFFQAQSANLNANQKALVDALRPADATNILTAGAVDPVTAPPALKPTTPGA
jgi:hypothetical protein